MANQFLELSLCVFTNVSKSDLDTLSLVDVVGVLLDQDLIGLVYKLHLVILDKVALLEIELSIVILPLPIFDV